MMNDIEDETEIFLHFKQKFTATRLIEGSILPTQFKIEADIGLDMDEDDDLARDYHVNVCLNKAQFWITQLLENSVIISNKDDIAREVFLDSGLEFNNNIMLCPDLPTNSHLAMLICAKLNSFGNGKVLFNGIKVESTNSKGLGITFVGDPMDFLPDVKTWVGERYYFDKAWWQRDDGSSIDVPADEDEDISVIPGFAVSLDFLNQSIDKSIGKSAVEDIKNKIIKPNFKPQVVKND
jgi:hypothetical protein